MRKNNRFLRSGCSRLGPRHAELAAKRGGGRSELVQKLLPTHRAPSPEVAGEYAQARLVPGQIVQEPLTPFAIRLRTQMEDR
jgi:hypothetical protein